jgi:hypothetical protein
MLFPNQLLVAPVRRNLAFLKHICATFAASDQLRVRRRGRATRGTIDWARQYRQDQPPGDHRPLQLACHTNNALQNQGTTMKILNPLLARKAALGCIPTLLLGSLLLAGCASTVPMNYSPSSVKSATGALSVADFRYLPAEPSAPKPVAADVIRNTAMGTIKIDREVKVFVRDAVFAELRFVGIKTNDGGKVLTGNIEEFLVDDLGFNVDWTLRINYSLTDSASKQVIYTSVKSTQRRTGKFVNPFGALNETLKLNVEQLLDDKDFIKAIN